MQFIARIEFETGSFDESFFDDDFLVVVNRHPKILKKRLIAIYDELKTWNQDRRSALCQLIHHSNDIELICKGEYLPPIIDKDESGIFGLLRDMFLDLYNQVLDGNGFKDKYKTTLRKHFDDFSRLNMDITLCPICGIGELKKHEDNSRDQYDHYLPKALYPLSAINFDNLVPCCKECNSFDAKGEDDTIAISVGRFFFPYDKDHKGICLSIKVIADNPDIKNIEWEILFSNPDGKDDEICTWRSLYKIDSRYQGFIKTRVEKWYKHFWGSINSHKLQHIPFPDRQLTYMAFLEEDEKLGLNFIRKPALEALLGGSVLAQAEMEAKAYSS